jgi:hypothetical protein
MGGALGFAIFGALAGLALEYLTRGLRAGLQGAVRRKYPNYEEQLYSQMSLQGPFQLNIVRFLRFSTENERYIAPSWYAFVGVVVSQVIYWSAR